MGINRWASTVSVASWSLPGDGSIGGLLPPELGELSGKLRSYTHLDVRATDEGLLVLPGGTEEVLDWRPASGSDVLWALLTKSTEEARPSQPGRIATELIRRLGGLDMLRSIQHEGLVKLLDDTARSQVELPEDPPSQRRRYVAELPRSKLLGELQRINDNDSKRAARHLAYLVDRGVLTSGVRLQCPNCTRRTWYSVEHLAEQLLCEGCIRTFPFPHAAPPAPSDWAYRTLGAFAVRDYAAGAYAVAFALKALATETYEPTSWSTNLQLDDRTEVDFAVVRQSRRSGTTSVGPQMLLGEAKSYGQFTEQDFARAARLRSRFPEAVLVFATLRKNLRRDEVTALRSLARPIVNRLAQVPEQPPLMVLTGLELFHHGRVADSWQEAEGRIGEIAAASRVIANNPEVLQIADRSLQIHLGLGPHHEWASQELQRLLRGSTQARRRSRNASS